MVFNISEIGRLHRFGVFCCKRILGSKTSVRPKRKIVRILRALDFFDQLVPQDGRSPSEVRGSIGMACESIRLGVFDFE